MPRYFLEVSYEGTNYSGFQVQENAKTIQSSVEAALQTLFKEQIHLTGSSRTDSGVHALQNFFHFDTQLVLTQKAIYNLNSILPPDIAAIAVYIVSHDAHCRFDGVRREYKYFIYSKKSPFLQDRAWYYPYKIDQDILSKAAKIIESHQDFIPFSKRNTQVNNFNCQMHTSFWSAEGDCLIYNVSANRFLRGMVRALVATMLKTARGNYTLDQFKSIITSGKQASADFSAPAHGLFLTQVVYPEGCLKRID